jgi:Integrase core domain.
LVDRIYDLRYNHEGWGAITILEELEDEGYVRASLPSIDAVNRYLKESGFIKKREPSSPMPKGKCKKAKHPHDLWEMDAQGANKVKRIGAVSMINIKDQYSKVHCMAFPVHVRTKMTQPKTDSYLWAMRLAFEQWGMPRMIQVDKDSVFIDNKSKSPFPSQVHLLLIGLGIKLCFIDVPPPRKQSMVERSHQTIDRQVMMGQEYGTWQKLFQFTNKRRKKMNEKLPNRMLNKKPPLTAFPDAKHSGRHYSVETEEQLIDMKRIFKYLSKCRWYRKVSSVKTLSLDSKIYYLKNAKPGTQLQIKFCNRRKKLIFQNDKELIVAIHPIKDFSIDYVMNATAKNLISMKKMLFKNKEFPL